MLERFFSRKERQKLFCSWAGSASMWIKVSGIISLAGRLRNNQQGGADVWGDASWAPDDDPGSSHTHGELIAFRQAAVPLSAHDITRPTRNMTADDASTWILERTPSTFQVDDCHVFSVE